VRGAVGRGSWGGAKRGPFPPPPPNPPRPRAHPADGEFQERPDDGRADQPDESRKAVDVDGADRQQRRRHEAQWEVAPAAGRLAQRQHEGEDEQGLDRLLEGPLGEVGGDDVGKAHDQSAGGARRRPQIRESGEGRERGQDRDGDAEAAEALDEADAETLVESDDDRVWPERVALVQQLAALAVSQPVRGQQVLGHIRVEAGAEDPEVALDRERQRGRQQRDQRNRPARAQRLPHALHPSPEIGDRRHHEDRHDDRRDDTVAPEPHRPPANRAEQRQADRRREPRPAPSPAKADGRLPDRQRRRAHRQHRCIGPDHEAASLEEQPPAIRHRAALGLQPGMQRLPRFTRLALFKVRSKGSR
jgi:hypothetical protein